jgi:hypothetical protein
MERRARFRRERSISRVPSTFTSRNASCAAIQLIEAPA